MKHFDLFVKGEPTAVTGEWRHVGDFEAPNTVAACDVARRYMKETGFTCTRIFTHGAPTIGRLVAECTGDSVTLADLPAFAGTADIERGARLDAARVTLELATKSTQRIDTGRMPIEDSPLFGGQRQASLF